MTEVIKTNPVHGTAVAVNGRGFLFIGPSGCGKSALAINMIALGADLISDDRVALRVVSDEVVMSAPVPISGFLEARFVGLLNAPTKSGAVLAHVVDLAQKAEGRLPELRTCDVLGCPVDLIAGKSTPSLAPALMLLGRHMRHE